HSVHSPPDAPPLLIHNQPAPPHRHTPSFASVQRNIETLSYNICRYRADNRSSNRVAILLPMFPLGFFYPSIISEKKPLFHTDFHSHPHKFRRKRVSLQNQRLSLALLYHSKRIPLLLQIFISGRLCNVCYP